MERDRVLFSRRNEATGLIVASSREGRSRIKLRAMDFHVRLVNHMTRCLSSLARIRADLLAARDYSFTSRHAFGRECFFGSDENTGGEEEKGATKAAAALQRAEFALNYSRDGILTY